MTTHQQLIYHIIFSTKNRQPYLTDGFREKTFGYLAGTARELEGTVIRVGGYYDHVHMLVHIPAKTAVSEFVRKVKGSFSKHINETSGLIRKFGWQDGYGVFTVSVSQKARLIDYIDQQMEHHRSQTFESEYVALLQRHEVAYDPRYVFD